MLTLMKNSLRYKDKDGNMQDSGVLFGQNETDITLTKRGIATDAEVTGNKLNKLSEEIGLTYACSIIDIINAIEPMSKVSFWLNNNTNIRTEVLNVFGITDKWGIFSVERNGDSLWTLKFKLYNEPITYVMRYTTTNDLGYSKVGSSDYLKKQYFNWKGVWVGVIEYPDFFFVYFREL